MHYLNDKGPCQTAGSIEGDDITALLKKYYTYNFTGLNVYEFQYDFAFSDEDRDYTDMLAAEILDHMLVQEDIPLNWLFDEKPTKTFWDDYKNPDTFTKYHALYCVCDSNFFDHTIWLLDRRAPHTCVYVYAFDVITKSIDVRVPSPMF